MKFIATLMNEEEAVGEVSSLATSNAPRINKRRTIEPTPEPSVDENTDGEDIETGSRKRRAVVANPETSGDETSDGEVE